MRLKAGPRRPRHASDPGLPRSPIHCLNAALYGAGARVGLRIFGRTDRRSITVDSAWSRWNFPRLCWLGWPRTRMLLALTGATGFIGQHLLRDLPKRGYRVRVLLRHPTPVPLQCASAVIGDLARPRNMSAALEGVDAVVHSAGFTHGMSGVPEDDYRLLNTEATIGLARAARRAGAKRFVFLSSIRAQSGPTAETVLTEANDPNPTDAYGKSKLAAERGLTELDLDWVSLRAALVYGPGVKGNIAQLMRLARSPLPLPLGSFGGRRSLLALENLSAAVETVLKAPGNLRRPFLAADAEALTVAEM